LSYLSLAGRPSFLLGVNYWSQSGGPRMWEADRFDAKVVEREIGSMRAFGANACRAFLFVPTFMPTPPVVDGGAVGRFRQFLDLAAKHGLAVYPSLLVGHMSGENFDFPGQAGRSLYTDPELLRWQVALCEGVCGAVRGHDAVAGWVLSNEMPLWGGKAKVDTIRRWAQMLFEAIRSADPGRPVGIGDGFMNQKGGQNGFDAAMERTICDWLGPHTYYADVDPLRHALQTEVLVRMLEGHGKPVVLEEFGCSSVQASPAHQAAYFRETIHSVLSLGGAGALGWCFGDLRLADEVPYSHHGFELGFGVVDADGRPKPVADEIRAASALCDRIDISKLSFPRPRAAIVLPSYYTTDYPFSSEDRSRMRRVLVQSYALALSAGIETAIVPEGASLDAFDLLLVPSTQKLLEPTWAAILARCRAGATVYASFFYSDNAFHQGMWWSGFEEATGLVHELRYGLPDPPGDRVVLRLGKTKLSAYPIQDLPFPAARLPIRLAGAKVVAKDGEGRPALTVMAHGRGRFFFLAYPWEYYLSRRAPSLEGDRSHALYVLLREAAGLSEPIETGSHFVHARRVGDLIWILNRAWIGSAGRIALPKGARCIFPEHRDPKKIGPKEAQVWQGEKRPRSNAGS
jgi:endo-1,4-beta-mannosidase